MNSFYLLVGLGCLLIVILALNVSRLRYKERIAHGHRDNKVLRNAMIAHENALEQIIPFSLLAFVLASQNTSDSLLQFLVIAFLTVRLAHAIGLTTSVFRAWQISAGLSYLLTLVSCGLVLYNLV